MLMVLLLYTDVLFLFACNFLQLFMLSVWKEHVESQSRILLPSGIVSILLIAIYIGYFRRRIKKQFNIHASVVPD